jgi:hypothetical protein
MFFPTLPFLPWSANKLAATAIFDVKGAKLRGFASQDEVAATFRKPVYQDLSERVLTEHSEPARPLNFLLVPPA